eukprot:4980009-Amphidinium_carterae.1
MARRCPNSRKHPVFLCCVGRVEAQPHKGPHHLHLRRSRSSRKYIKKYKHSSTCGHLLCKDVKGELIRNET